MTQENNKKDEAVSDTVGFILIFGIVILSMGIIYTTGYPTLQSNMDTSIFESAEQSFIVLQSNMKMVAFDQVPVKNQKMKLHSTAFLVNNESNISIEYDNKTRKYSFGQIEYSQDNRILTYENGAVLKKYENRGTVLTSDPNIYESSISDTNITTISVVSVNGNTSASGRGIITINMQHNRSSMIKTDNTVNVTLKINSTYAQQWKKYLEDTGFTAINMTDSTLTMQKKHTILLVGIHTVNVDIN